jgi:hypothetical protein
LRFGQNFDQSLERLDLKGVTSLQLSKEYGRTLESLDLRGVTVSYY